MPVKKFDVATPEVDQVLVDELAAEWSSPDSGRTEPVIIEASPPPGLALHIFVVWTKWAQLERQVRGEIIMDAAERVKSKTDFIMITQVWGLTPTEADQIGLKWR